MAKLPTCVDATLDLLKTGNYIADRSLATALYLSLSLNKPLFLEGEAGVGKTEIAKVLSSSLNRQLIRLQCYEGLDVASAVYEWNYARQMLEIRLQEASSVSRDTAELTRTIFKEDFIIEELQRGYHLEGKVLRHALVKVSMGPGKQSSQEEVEKDTVEGDIDSEEITSEDV